MEDTFTYIGNSEINSIEDLYKEYLKNKDSVAPSWRDFFKGFEFATKHYSHSLAKKDSDEIENEFKVMNLIHAYRQRGHLFTDTNPVRARRKYYPTLEIKNFGLQPTHLEKEFQAGDEIGIGKSTLKNIVDRLKRTYCKSIGPEFIYMRDPQMIQWLRERMEKTQNIPHFTIKEKKYFYNLLKKTVGFEKYIHKKFVGQKRFSIEGTEGIIPTLNYLIDKGAELGVEEFIIGMPHRGRLNILANVIQKPIENIFHEFEGKIYQNDIILGDVKYHLAYGNTVTTQNGNKVKLNLAPNPSHLETVGPIITGVARAKIDNNYNGDSQKIVPIIIHGDAAIAGQGVVYEVIQMSQLKGYKTGGTIHLVINNQVGFTTNYVDARSSTYCTDIAKVTRSPVFHVNGDDVESLIYTIQLAIEFRQKFHIDVFIDMLSYRKYGHNEGDEPRFTQPLLYRTINKHPNPRDIYKEKLIEEKVYTQQELLKLEKEYDSYLDEKYNESQTIEEVYIQPFLQKELETSKADKNKNFQETINTGVEKRKLIEISNKINTLPQNKHFFRKIEKLLDSRQNMIKNNTLDWAMCELLSYGSLLEEGYPIRISGQDSERGTFAHRHAVHTLENVNEKYIPLKHLRKQQAEFNIFNSPLSEYGVLGFEYGYALAAPFSLTIWEAQFGDFINVAQVIIDQYISSANEKWGLSNGLVLYLPHGFEGQGAEHSSARIERFLNLSAHNNMNIVNCTTPANLFHILRKHTLTKNKIPLIIFTPKSLLRHPKCTSTLDELENGQFEKVIDDFNAEVNKTKKVVFCSGKIYYEIVAEKEKQNLKDIAIVRIEHLYPFPQKEMQAIIDKYKKSTDFFFWVQEEPINMGAWNYVRQYVAQYFATIKLTPITRKPSGSPATGLSEIHIQTQKEIIGKIFKKCDCSAKYTYCNLECDKK